MPKKLFNIKVDDEIHKKYKLMRRSQGLGGNMANEFGALCDRHMTKELKKNK